MNGPAVVAHTLSWPAVPDQFGNLWQYHGRSDRHSKVACWAVVVDLLFASALLRAHAAAEKVVFAVNHSMSDFVTRRRKQLDLVIAQPDPSGRPPRVARDLIGLGADLGVRLTAQQQQAVAALPPLCEGAAGSVLIAIEAKACMTEHGKARPRLYDELTSSHLIVHGASERALALGVVLVNAAPTFVSPDRNRFDTSVQLPNGNPHNQPHAVDVVDHMVRELPRRTRPGEVGYDALGIVDLDCRNDGTPVTVVSGPPAPPPGDPLHYDSMIHRAAQQYELLFGGI